MIEYQYKTFWNRFWAGIIDSFVLSPLFFPEKFIVTQTSPRWLVSFWIVFQGSVPILYTILFLGWKGQTIGKMICGVKVIDISGNPLSMRQAAMRESIPAIFAVISILHNILDIDWYVNLQTASSIETIIKMTSVWVWVLASFNLIWFVLELVTMLTNKKRRAVHDYMGRSVVIKVSQKILNQGEEAHL
jgi:uncharacterized RDD family membrane protein YckC